MKKNKKMLMIVGILLVATISVTFAYFAVGVLFQGEGASTIGKSADMIKVSYDAGSSSLNVTNLYPGKSASKTFTVTVTPGSDTNTATYSIKLNIDTNTFVYCDDTNYNTITNQCKKNEEEIIYTLKDGNGNVISSKSLMKQVGSIELARETKTVSAKTVFNYTLEITFKETNADQNHNANKTITGNVKVEYVLPADGDFNILAINLENDSGNYESTNTMPTSGYHVNQSKSYCTVGGEEDKTIELELVNGRIIASNAKTGTNCYVYLDKDTCGTACQAILANINTIATRTSFSTPVTITTTSQMYQTYDDDGTSYYFAGNPTDNWVQFGGFYWRIIRINGDGTIRMIYQGTAANTTGTGTQISNDGGSTITYAFNSSCNNNMYVGYMYTSDKVHGLGTSSTIKGELDTWYDSNLASYASYIDTNAGFCGDRTSTTTNGGAPNDTGGTGTTQTFYGARYRLYTNKTPSLKCTYSSDLYTPTGSSKGNKALSKAIGLITADEVAYAGGVYGTNNSGYYLYTGQYYWTISPSWFDSSDSNARVFYVSRGGDLYNADVYWTVPGVRPVINLKADTAFADGGTGTSSNPYVVS